MSVAEIVYPTLDVYAARVEALAEKYHRVYWMELMEIPLERLDEEDRFEFSFIKECLWESLIRREFEFGLEDGPPGPYSIGMQDKPGSFPGLSFKSNEVMFERSRVRRPHKKSSGQLPVFGKPSTLPVAN